MPKPKRTITEAIVDESFDLMEYQHYGIKRVSLHFHFNEHRLRLAMIAKDAARWERIRHAHRLKQVVFLANLNRTRTGHLPPVTGENTRKTPLAIDRLATRWPVRRLDAFAPDEVRQLQAKVKTWVACGSGKAMLFGYLTTLP